MKLESFLHPMLFLTWFLLISLRQCVTFTTNILHTSSGKNPDQDQDQRGSTQNPMSPSGGGLTAATAWKMSDERRLYEHLMANYDNTIRPVINAKDAVVIRLGITLTQIFDLDEKNQVLTTNVWLDQEWIDEFLTWDPAQFGNISKIRIPCERIWLPDIVLYNSFDPHPVLSADDYTRGYFNSRAIIEPNGNVFWPPPTKFRSTCSVDVTYFPFDDQTCKLKLGSWIYDGFQVDVLNRTDGVDLENYIPNGEWDLMNAELRRNVITYPCCPEPFPDVTITLVIRRKTLYYMYNIVVPCMMLSVLTLLVFCLPPDSGEKIALGVTVLLAFSVFELAISEKLPETSESIPLLGIYLTVVMAITSVSIVMTVIVLNIHYRGPIKKEMPQYLKRLLPDDLVDHRFTGSYRDQEGRSWSAASQQLTGSEARQPPGAASQALNAHLIKTAVAGLLVRDSSQCYPRNSQPGTGGEDNNRIKMSELSSTLAEAGAREPSVGLHEPGVLPPAAHQLLSPHYLHLLRTQQHKQHQETQLTRLRGSTTPPHMPPSQATLAGTRKLHETTETTICANRCYHIQFPRPHNQISSPAPHGIERPTSSASMFIDDEDETPSMDIGENEAVGAPRHASPHAHHHQPGTTSSTGGANYGTAIISGRGIEDELGQILSKLMQRQELEDAHNKVVQEWRYLALIIDKILFWIFLVMTVGCSVLFLVILPAKRRGFDLV